MQIKDIVNRDVVNLTNCEHEPIHIPGSIQPHGFLLAVKAASLVIDFCSANCSQFIQLSHEQLLGKTISEALGNTLADKLNQYISSDHVAAAPLVLDISGRQFSCSVQSSNNMHLLEFEPVVGEEIVVADIYLQAKQFTTYMQEAATLQSLCQSVAEETRAITGYDRVMIYKFDEDYNGEVFAESCNDDLEPFLGLHYPHTDIPVQARELYIKNLMRLIADVNYVPVPLYTIDDAPNKNLDLSFSTLRSVSPIHVQYLHNMGVGATLTISLIYEGKLWGLIACHHYSPKYITMHTRIAAQLQGHFLTSQISVRQDAEEYTVSRTVNKALEALLSQVFSTEMLSFQNLVQQPGLLQIANAGGVILMVDDDIYTQGAVPSNKQIKELAAWLYMHSNPAGFYTEKLIDIYPAAKEMNMAAGIVFHSLGSGYNNCIIWCRPEALQEVNWAGDPQKAIVKDDKGLSPRKSFELWKEVKKWESAKWQKPELVAAANFASALQKHVHMLFLSKEELKQRKLSEKLKEANAELENINWIGSHDLKEPLRKIQMFASRVLESEDDTTAGLMLESIKKMSESASRMQILIKDILSYSKLTHIEDGFKDVSLNDIMNDVINELSVEINQKHAVVEVGTLPVIKAIPVLMRQLFVNLLTNSLNFSQPGIAPHIIINAEITSEVPGVEDRSSFHKITISDNGVGFDNQFNETIFKVFTRLQQHEEQHGTGVGLALCKKIMQNHNGYISAHGVPGKGAELYLYFPAR